MKLEKLEFPGLNVYKSNIPGEIEDYYFFEVIDGSKVLELLDVELKLETSKLPKANLVLKLGFNKEFRDLLNLQSERTNQHLFYRTIRVSSCTISPSGVDTQGRLIMTEAILHMQQRFENQIPPGGTLKDHPQVKIIVDELLDDLVSRNRKYVDKVRLNLLKKYQPSYEDNLLIEALQTEIETKQTELEAFLEAQKAIIEQKCQEIRQVKIDGLRRLVEKMDTLPVEFVRDGI